MASRPRATTLRRLGVLERKRNSKRSNRPVAMWGKLMTVDKWEAIAHPSQQRLKANVREDGPVDYSGIPELELVPSS